MTSPETPLQRQIRREKFAEKNKRRRALRERIRKGEPGLRGAQEQRREVGGHFGRLPSRVFNAYAHGTGAEPRLEVKGDES